MGEMPWFVKHKARKFTELFFSTDVHIRTLQWLTKTRHGVLHITGPVGSGKTVLAHAVATALKYNVIEIHDGEFERARDYAQHRGTALNGRRNLLLIDEGAVLGAAVSAVAQHLIDLSKNMPVIVTSSELRLKGIETFKTDRMSIENVHRALRRVLKLESGCGHQIDDRTVSRLAVVCNSDFRLVLNYAQLYSKNPCAFKSVQEIERIAGPNIFLLCERLFMRRMRFSELAAVHDGRMLGLCLGSLALGCRDTDFIAKCLTKASAAAELPKDYEFLELDHIGQHTGGFVYQKDAVLQGEAPKRALRSSGHFDPLHFLPHIIRNKSNRRSAGHLQAIFKLYNLKNLSAADSEILNLANFEAIESKAFKYKYNAGSSNAVRRDVSLSEVLGP